MILSTGKNDFRNNTFDKYRWSANTYETPEEILAYLHGLEIYGKRVRSVSAIGALTSYSLDDWETIALRKLSEAGIVTDYDICDEWVELRDGSRKSLGDCFDLIKNVSADRSVTLCEPFLIIFEDGNVLELLPSAPRGLRIGYNTLPKEMRNGANRAEYDIGVLFNRYLCGREFCDFDMLSAVWTKTYNGPRKNRITKQNQYSFDFLYETLILKEVQCSEYEVSLSDMKTISCGELADLKQESYQTAIMEGWHHGMVVIVYPVPGTDSGIVPWDADFPDIFSADCGGPALYTPLLKKYFDPELPANKEHSQGYYDFFYWNYYTRGSIIQMVAEARKNLDDVHSLPVEAQSKVLSCRFRGDTKEQMKIRIREEIDYIERFSERLLGMALSISEDDYICFNGP